MNFSFPELIRINIPFIIILVLLVITGGAAYWLYRTTTPPVTNLRRLILGGMRAWILFLVLILFFMPAVKLTYIRSKPLKTGVFIDNSGSMFVKNPAEDRKKMVDSVLAYLKPLLQDQQVSWYIFNQNTLPLTGDTIPVTKAATNFETMLHALEKSGADQSVLVSDGVITDGKINFDNRIPFGTKIHVIGIGSEEGERDIFISNVLYSPTAYMNERQEIEVQVANTGVYGQKTVLKLYQEGTLLDSRTIDIETPDAEQTVLFSWNPGKPGLHTLTLVLDRVDGESNTVNNTYLFAQEILKNKIRVAVFGGLPGYESKFIRFVLQKNKDYIVKSFIENKQGRYINHQAGSFLDSLDVVIFEGFPGPHTRFPETNGLIARLRQQRPGLILFLNSAMDFQNAKTFGDILPEIQVTRDQISGEFSIHPPDIRQIHPVLQVFSEPERTILFWDKIPPLISLAVIRNFPDTYDFLAEGIRANQRVPVIISIENRYGKSLVFNGDGFWRWHFLLQNDPVVNDGYAALLSHSVRWVAHKNTLKPVMIRTNSTIIRLGETFQLSANLFDAERRPVRDGTLVIEAEWEDQRFVIDAVHDGAGNYNAELWPPGAGMYRVVARGERGGLLLGEDSLELQVIPYQKEFIRTEQNAEFLKTLAAQSGGTYLSVSELEKLEPLLRTDKKYLRHEEEVEIWYKPLLLFMILLFITLEWIIRKGSGLV